MFATSLTGADPDDYGFLETIRMRALILLMVFPEDPVTDVAIGGCFSWKMQKKSIEWETFGYYGVLRALH